MEVSIFNNTGADTGRTVELKDAIFGIEPNDHAIYLDVKRYLANQRQGTHKAKERSDITGSTKKIKRQKGTGTARSGSIKSPLFRGGGVIFGPKPRDYTQKVNKKVKKLARKSALTYKAREEGLRVIEDFTLDSPKTKDIVSLREALNIEKKLLIVLPDQNKNLYLSARNLQDTEVITASQLSTYMIMKYNNIVFFESSLGCVEENLN